MFDVPNQNTVFQVFFKLTQKRLITFNHNLYPAVIQVTHKTGDAANAPGDFLRVPAKTDWRAWAPASPLRRTRIRLPGYRPNCPVADSSR